MPKRKQKYIQETFDTNWVIPLGANVDFFKKALSKSFVLSEEGTTQLGERRFLKNDTFGFEE